MFLISEALSACGTPLRKTCVQLMSPFGLCFRSEMGLIQLFIIKLVSELGGLCFSFFSIISAHNTEGETVIYKLTIFFPQ